jgi:glycosyltransferase involved in cell wall biosynthesis
LNTPFFSILIPTRNRPDLLRDALVSALFQDFDDFEVVVSDNCNDDRTQKVLDEFLDHPRLRCVRPERLLQMPEHWEFASLQAKGIYVLFLTDRSVLKRHALKTIYNAVNAVGEEVSVCSWRWSSYDDLARREFGDVSTHTGGVEMVLSQILCEDFTEGACQYPYSLPRGLNSCYRKELVCTLQDQYGAVFRPMSPDFTSAFLLLSKINSVLYIDQALFISQGLGISNGGNAYTKTAAAYLQKLGERDWFSQVPIKAPLVENAIFQDFLSVRDLAGGVLSRVNIDWAAYFERCYRELIEKQGAGQLSSHEIKELFADWSRALAGFDDQLQHEVRRRLNSLGWVKLKAKLKGSVIGPFARRLKRKIDNVRRGGWQACGGQSVLDAAGFSKEIL